jgi:hypothetical protein
MLRGPGHAPRKPIVPDGVFDLALVREEIFAVHDFGLALASRSFWRALFATDFDDARSDFYLDSIASSGQSQAAQVFSFMMGLHGWPVDRARVESHPSGPRPLSENL